MNDDLDRGLKLTDNNLKVRVLEKQHKEAFESQFANK